MCYWIMGNDGIPITESAVQDVTQDGRLDPDITVLIGKFHEALNARLDDKNFTIP